MEGNFAFAAGLQEMLIQSHTGIIQVFPAIPKSWNTLSFDKLRTEGAFLVSVNKENGQITNVEIFCEKGGVLKLKNPFGHNEFIVDAEFTINNDIIEILTTQNQKINLKL